MKLLLDRNIEKTYTDQIYDQIKSKIRQKHLVSGQKLPSIRKLSEQCDVSEGIIRQVVKSLAADGYVTSRSGVGLFVNGNSLKTGNIAILLPSLMDEHIWRIVSGVKSGMLNSKKGLVIYAADCDFEEEMRIAAEIDKKEVSGVLVYPPPTNRYLSILRDFQHRGVPFVQIDTSLEIGSANSVTTDGQKMGDLAMRHLLERGHRRICVLTHTGNATSLQAIRDGFSPALAEYGMEYEDLPVFAADAEITDTSTPWAIGERMAKRAIEQFPETTALLALHAHLASGSLLAMKSVGKRIPEDISLLSLGNIKVFDLTGPPVTAIDQPYELIGSTGVERLFATIDDPNCIAKNILLSPKLIDRQSVKKL